MKYVIALLAILLIGCGNSKKDQPFDITLSGDDPIVLAIYAQEQEIVLLDVVVNGGECDVGYPSQEESEREKVLKNEIYVLDVWECKLTDIKQVKVILKTGTFDYDIR